MPSNNAVPSMQFRRPAILAVREAVKSGLFKREGVSVEQKVEILKALAAAIVAAYNVERAEPLPEVADVRIVVPPLPGMIVGAYAADERVILIDKPSLTSFLYGLALHIQKHRDGIILPLFGNAFATGLFKRALPRSYEAARAAGRILIPGPSEATA